MTLRRQGPACRPGNRGPRSTNEPRAAAVHLGTPTIVALALAAVAAAAGPLAASVVGPPGKSAADRCTACHRELDEERLKAPALAVGSDIHHAQGVTCAGCHGGDPTSDEPEVAMDPKKGFLGKLEATRVPEMCGSCHSNASFMLRYAPNIPTDQLAQYRTSKHGQALAKGDAKVAVCSSCHGAHGVLPPSDARSPVYPSRIVETCGACHGDAALMARYGIRGDELAEYKRSVHYAALTQKNDLSAPTCNDCHGSHGAAPPGVSSVSNVCGTCHLTQRERFDESPHKEAFAAIEQPACEACHSNHAVLSPGDAWIGVGEGQVCGSCHAAGDAGAAAAESVAAALARMHERLVATEARVKEAERAGMLMEEAQVKLEEAHQGVVLAQVEIHSVDPARVETKAKEVLAAAGVADGLAAAAEAEIRFRRTGLFVSLAVIALAMVALILKIRRMEAT
jgi:predicted CXXCH cytochrome family protein